METDSDTRNIAKSFFEVNKENHVCLVQYMSPNGASGEHYHTLDEIILQLVGKSFLEIRPIDDDSSREIIELSEGHLYSIERNNLHIVRTLNEGSITIPIKKTIPGKKDHLYLFKSQKRISSEISQLIDRNLHYNSGNEILSTLESYYLSLKPLEKEIFSKYLSQRIKTEKNPNLKIIFEKIKI